VRAEPAAPSGPEGSPAPEWRLVHVATDPTSLSFLRGQVGYMRERGFAIHAIASPGEYLQTFSAAEGVPVSAVPMARRITPLADLASLAGLVRELRRIRPHVVHSHTPKGGLLGMIAAWIARVPVRVYHMRGLPMLAASGWRGALLRITERVSSLLAHRTLCVSPSVRDVAVAAGLAPAAKLRVLANGSGNGVDAAGRFDPARLPEGTRADVRSRLGVPADAVLVGYVGRLVCDKGIVELAEAWRAVSARRPGTHLLLIGPYEPQDPVPEPVRAQLASDPTAHLLGMNWDTPPYYAAMDVLVLPTYREGFPNVVLEASAMSLPVVATAVPGCVDAVVPGETGTLVPVRDPAALATAILRYAEDPALRARHGAAGRRRVLEKFAPRVIWRALFAEYAELLQTRLGADPASAHPRAAELS
jgi:glycosyltransferase involved in cell wall biosynthesis